MKNVTLREYEVKALLARQRKTLGSLAAYLGCSVSLACRMLKGQRGVSLSHARAMAKYLGVALDKITS